MARISFAAHPFLLGFEQIDRILEKTIKSSNDGFPPYNIELSDDNHYKITLAVAGFSEDELSITLEERQLIISGKQVEKTNQNTFIYRGIAARHFQKTFVLADGVEVSGASLENGLLNVFLLRKNLQPKVKTIKINSNNWLRIKKNQNSLKIYFSDKNFSASKAAIHPIPAAVTACLYLKSVMSPAAKTPGIEVSVEFGFVTT